MVNFRSQDDLRPTTGDHDLDPFMQDWVDSEERLKPAAVLVPLVEHPSGITVGVHQNADIVTLQVWLPAGFVDEPHDAAGVATRVSRSLSADGKFLCSEACSRFGEARREMGFLGPMLRARHPTRSAHLS